MVEYCTTVSRKFSVLPTILDQAAQWAAALSCIVETGLVPLDAMPTERVSDLPKRESVMQTIATTWIAIDSLALPIVAAPPPAPTIDSLGTQISAQVIIAQTALTTALSSAGGAGAPVSRSVESHRLRFQIAALSIASWIVSALLVTTVGSYLLIFSHLDFGRVNDFWLCFLWGLGLPIVGGQLSQATPASLASGLGVSVMKFGP